MRIGDITNFRQKLAKMKGLMTNTATKFFRQPKFFRKNRSNTLRQKCEEYDRGVSLSEQQK